MLVLTRKRDESLVINDNIVVTVLAIEGDKVKIGITAPREITVLRHELWQAMNEQRQIAEQLAGKTESPGFEELRRFLANDDSAGESEANDPDEGPSRAKP